MVVQETEGEVSWQVRVPRSASRRASLSPRLRPTTGNDIFFYYYICIFVLSILQRQSATSWRFPFASSFGPWFTPFGWKDFFFSSDFGTPSCSYAVTESRLLHCSVRICCFFVRCPSHLCAPSRRVSLFPLGVCLVLPCVLVSA